MMFFFFFSVVVAFFFCAVKNAVKKWQMNRIGWLLLVWLDRVVHSAKSWFPLYLVGQLVVLHSLDSLLFFWTLLIQLPRPQWSWKKVWMLSYCTRCLAIKLDDSLRYSKSSGENNSDIEQRDLQVHVQCFFASPKGKRCLRWLYCLIEISNSILLKEIPAFADWGVIRDVS